MEWAIRLLEFLRPSPLAANDDIFQDIPYVTFPFFIRGPFVVEQLLTLEIPVSLVGISS